MNSRYRQVLTLSAIFIFAMIVVASLDHGSLLAAQGSTQQQQHTSPSQTNQGSGSVDRQYGQTTPPGGSTDRMNQVQGPVTGETDTPTGARSGIGWGSLFLGLVIGFLAGMMMRPRIPGSRDDRFRRDRAA
jgi:hypothetical protein